MKLLKLNTYPIQTICIFVYLSVMQLTTWLPLRYWSAWGGGNFLDTWQVLNYSKCYNQIGLDIYRSDVGGCSSYLYGRSLIQFLAFFKIGPIFTQLIGYVFLLLLAASISRVFLIEKRSDVAILGVVLMSPPILLLADRGNFDIVILAAIIIASRLFRTKYELLSVFVVLLTALMKYYTAPLLLLFIFKAKSLYVRVLSALSILLVSVLIIRDIRITSTSYPHGSGSQFGVKIWGEYLNLYNLTSGSNSRNFLICLILFLLTVLVSLKFASSLTPDSNLKLGRDFLLQPENYTSDFLLLTFISCFIAGMNFDYRLTIFACAVLGSLKRIDGFSKSVTTVFIGSVLWASFPSGGLQPIGDLLLEFGVAISLVNIIKSHRHKEVKTQ